MTLKTILITVLLPGIFTLTCVGLLLTQVIVAKLVMYGVYTLTYVSPFFIPLVASVMLVFKIKASSLNLKKLHQGTARTNVQSKTEKNKQQLITMVIVVTIAYLLTHLPGQLPDGRRTRRRFSPPSPSSSTP
jgi:archaellum biogenesis protein FlaJ (TadC family)